MPAGDGSPLRRISEPSLECRGVVQGAKAISHRVFRRINVHVPLEFSTVEPIQYVHRVLIEGQRDLIRKVSVDFEDEPHSLIENE